MSGKIKLSTLFICIGLFFVFLLFRFPFKNVRGYVFNKIYEQTKIFIVADDLYPSLFGWPGIGITNVDVTIPLAGTDWNLSSKKLIFRVGLGQFFPPVPSVSLSLKELKKGGDLFFKVSHGKDRTTAKWDADQVTIDQLLGSDGSNPVMGAINTDGNLSVATKELTKSSGYAEINVVGLKTPAQLISMAENYSFLIPALQIGPVKGKIQVRNGSAEITSFQIGDANSDIRGTITGELRLGSEWMQCFVNITLNLQISDKIMQNPQANAFVSFLSGYKTGTPGAYGMKWSKSVQELSGLTLAVLPEPVSK